MKIRILRRLGMVPFKDVQKLVNAQFEERLNAYNAGWDGGFLAGIETASREVAA